MAQLPQCSADSREGEWIPGKAGPLEGERGTPAVFPLAVCSAWRASWRKGLMREGAAGKNKRGVSEACRTPGTRGSETQDLETTCKGSVCNRKANRPGVGLLPYLPAVQPWT